MGCLYSKCCTGSDRYAELPPKKGTIFTPESGLWTEHNGDPVGSTKDQLCGMVCFFKGCCPCMALDTFAITEEGRDEHHEMGS